MPPKVSSTQQLAEHLLGTDLREWILERRSGEAARPWRVIAHDLKIATGGQVTVSREMVRRWAEVPAKETAA